MTRTQCEGRTGAVWLDGGEQCKREAEYGGRWCWLHCPAEYLTK